MTQRSSQQRGASKLNRLTRRAEIGTLESRLLLCADHLAAAHLPGNLGTFPELNQVQVPASAASTSTGTAAAGVSLSSVPPLSSRASAPAQLFLDFNGDTTTAWGSYHPGVTSAFDQDGDPTTFSDGELASIREIWSRVAEKYSPFNINITTVDPGALTDRVAAKVVVGGDGAWLGAQAGGVAYVGGFSNTAPNTAFVFDDNLGNGYPRYVAEGIAHESGHLFGLYHQATWSGSTLTNEYNPGSASAAPVMGNSYTANRGLWWNGLTSNSSTSTQDDVSVIASANNAFGYRADDFGNALSTAGQFNLSGLSLSSTGVIERTSDVDVFRFDTGSGPVNFTASPAQYGGMLDLKLGLYNSAGALVAAADTANLGESFSTTLSSGTYFLSVTSKGYYGDIGQYSISGTVAEAAAPVTVAAPSALAAHLSAGVVNLNWQDNSSNETAFLVQRSTDGGATWANYASVGADATGYQDAAVSAGGKYRYRVYATNGSVNSPVSNDAAITLATTAPANLSASAASASQINLAWSDVFGETAYRIERSTDNLNWSAMASVAANATGFQNTGLPASTTWFYRVIAVNDGGDSAPSNTASARTLTPVINTVPAAPGFLRARTTSSTTMQLTWIDNASNESAFGIEYSTDAGRTFRVLGSVSANVTAVDISGLRPHATYWWRIRAYNSSASSPYSNIAYATTARYGSLPAAARSTLPFSASPIAGKGTLESLLAAKKSLASVL